MEEWKPIVVTKKGKTYDYTGRYEVSSLGRIRSLDYNHTGRAEIKKPNVRKYLQIQLCKDGKLQAFLVHRIVAEVFIPNPNNYTDVNHINEDKHDNRVENLEWMPHDKNLKHGTCPQRIGKAQLGGKNHQAKKVICLETGQVFDSIRDAERWLGKINGSISACCRGKQKTAYGYSWEYVQEDD